MVCGNCKHEIKGQIFKVRNLKLCEGCFETYANEYCKEDCDFCKNIKFCPVWKKDFEKDFQRKLDDADRKKDKEVLIKDYSIPRDRKA